MESLRIWVWMTAVTNDNNFQSLYILFLIALVHYWACNSLNTPIVPALGTQITIYYFSYIYVSYLSTSCNWHTFRTQTLKHYEIHINANIYVSYLSNSCNWHTFHTQTLKYYGTLINANFLRQDISWNPWKRDTLKIRSLWNNTVPNVFAYISQFFRCI